MRFRFLSDIHNEHRLDSYGIDFEIKPEKSDKDTTLLLGGDVGLLALPDTYVPFLEKCSKQFKEIIWIFGNHEFYHGKIDADYSEHYNHIKNLVVLNENNPVYRIGNISIVGSTLWTDFLNDPLQEIVCTQNMNDYYIITKTNGEINSTTYIKSLHWFQKNAILTAIETEKSMGQKVVVMTHHCPSMLFRDMDYNFSMVGGYISELDQKIERLKPDYWLCGHVHKSNNFEIAGTKMISNPVGYPGQRTDYDIRFGFEII